VPQLGLYLRRSEAKKKVKSRFEVIRFFSGRINQKSLKDSGKIVCGKIERCGAKKMISFL